jgi:hypothetical protein
MYIWFYEKAVLKNTDFRNVQECAFRLICLNKSFPYIHHCIKGITDYMMETLDVHYGIDRVMLGLN